MFDFSVILGPELIRMNRLEADRVAERSRWNRELRQTSRAGASAPTRRLWLCGGSEARRRRELFSSALEASQREGITVDAWFSYKFADPELSARAEWAGLIDDAQKSAKDVWAA